MKRISVSFLVIMFTLGSYAQESDSLLLLKVESLGRDLQALKKKNKQLTSRVYSLQKAHEKDQQAANEKFAAAGEARKKNSTRLDEQEAAMKASEESTDESISVLGDWTRQVLMILAIVFSVLFLILLILIITNRRRIEKEYTKLESKVDNTKESIELDIKEVLKRHEDDITALKSLVEKEKK
jgi:hypothetical protein